MHNKILMLSMVAGLVVQTSWAQADGTPVQGLIVSVQGPAMTIELDTGAIKTATTNAALSESLVGKWVQGTLQPAGDGYLIVAPAYSDPKQQ